MGALGCQKVAQKEESEGVGCVRSGYVANTAGYLVFG